MTLLALALVLIAAVLHATWNLCAKRAGGGLPFVWLVGAIICALYVPVVAIYGFVGHRSLPAGGVWWIFGSGVWKTTYSLVLQRSYRKGDFSLIYPLARGTGPLLSTGAAILLLGERPSAIALLGGMMIIGSIFLLTGGTKLFHQDSAHLRTAVNYGLASGACIATYTIWDRHGVGTLAIVPLLYDAGTAYTQLLLLTPFAVKRWPEVKAHWREHRRYAIGVAVLAPIAYVLVLTAMSFTSVSYIAPAREISIVFGAFIGARFLKETNSRRRVWAAIAVTVGVIALAIG